MFITHDLIEAFKLGHRIAFMRDGKIIQVGKPLEILANPSTDFISHFIKNLPVLNILKIKDILKDDFDLNSSSDNALNVVIKYQGENFSLYDKVFNKKYENLVSLDLELNDEIKKIVEYLNKQDYLIIKVKGAIVGYINLNEISDLLSR